VRKFKKGDPVEYTGETYCGISHGVRGTILGYPTKETTNENVSFNRKNRDVAVAFSKYSSAQHNCDGLGEGLYIGELYLKSIKES
jgi:hypothetical protein